ncbi:hypothetical protein BH09VER1_BH09VER1_01120 [soil metagenome]
MDEKPKPGHARWWIIGASLIVVLLVAIFAPIALLLYAMVPVCGNDHEQAFPSPNGQLKAVIFRRDCGATTSYSMNVSILPAAQALPNDAGNVFVKDDVTPPTVRWLDDTHLFISETWPGKILRNKPMLGKVQISYQEGT